jgi:putative ABC transport system permease protein
VGIYVSEAMVDLYGARPAAVFAPLAAALQPGTDSFFVAGVWRDYARQSGAIVMDSPTLSA